jgi:hypothetical protein
MGLIPTTSSSRLPTRTYGAGASGYTYTFKPQPNERTDVDVANVRGGKNFKGRVLGLVLGTLGKGKPEKAFANTVKAIEARNYGARTAEQT